MQDWALITGSNLPFWNSIYISQPSLLDLASYFPDEHEFLKILQLVSHNRETLKKQLKEDIPLENNFYVLLMLLNTAISQGDNQIEQSLHKFLKLLFKDFIVDFSNSGIMISDENETFIFINGDNYDILQKLIHKIFCLDKLFSPNEDVPTDYNPQGDRSKRIAEMLNKRHDVLANLHKESAGKSVFANYIEILSVDLGISLLEIRNYTLYQLMRCMERCNLFEAFDIDLKCRLAGGGSDKEVEHWRKII